MTTDTGNWPRRSTPFTFSNGETYEVCLLDAMLLEVIGELYRRHRLAMIEQTFDNAAERDERVLQMKLSDITVSDILNFARTPKGLQACCVEALLASNPGMDRDKALGLCGNPFEMSRLVRELKGASLPSPEQNDKAGVDSTGNPPEVEQPRPSPASS